MSGRGWLELHRQAFATGTLLYLQLDLTWRCNLRCVHCYIAEHHPPGLSLARLQAVLDEARRLGTLFLLLSGGEPLLREDLPELLDCARRLRFAVSINTNGTLITPAWADALAARSPLEIGVSLYSGDPGVHDGITGVAGSGERTLEAVRLLCARGVRVQLKTMVLPGSQDAWQDVGRLAGELGTRWSLDHTIFPRSDGDLAHAQRQRVSFGSKRLAADEQHAFDHRRGLPALVQGEPLWPEPERAPLCLAGRASLYVHPAGRVQPCAFWPRPLGDLRDEALATVWQRVQADPLLSGLCRGRMRGGCPSCSLREKCSFCPGLQEQLRGDPLLPAELICARTRAWHGLPEEGPGGAGPGGAGPGGAGPDHGGPPCCG